MHEELGVKRELGGRGREEGEKAAFSSCQGVAGVRTRAMLAPLALCLGHHDCPNDGRGHGPLVRGA